MKNLFIILVVSFTSLKSFAESKHFRLHRGNEMIKARVISPEGIAVTPSGNIFVTSITQAEVHQMSYPNYEAKSIFSAKKQLPGDVKFIEFLGIVAQSDKVLWIAAKDYRGGCILKLELKGKDGVFSPAVCGLGMPNGLLVDQEKGLLYVSANDKALSPDGTIYRFRLSELNKNVALGLDSLSAEDSFLKTKMPNGLAFSPNKDALLFSQTLDDKVMAVDLKSKKLTKVLDNPESGWLDGLIYFPSHNYYAVSDSKNGSLHFFTYPNKGLVRSYYFTDSKGETTGPASMALYKDNILFTDLWEPSLFRKSFDVVVDNYKSIKASVSPIVNFHSSVFAVPLDAFIPKNNPKRSR